MDYTKFSAALAELFHQLQLFQAAANVAADKQKFLDAAADALWTVINARGPIVTEITVTPVVPATP